MLGILHIQYYYDPVHEINSVWFVLIFCAVLLLHLTDCGSVMIRAIMKKAITRIIRKSELVRYHCIFYMQEN
jgi:hypothetical protein